MEGNLIIGILIFFISMLIVYFLIILFSYLNPKKDLKFPEVESEAWQNGDKELTILYVKNSRPAQNIIDDVKNNINRYDEETIAYLNNSEQYKKYLNDGITLEGVTFPALRNDLSDLDFSIDYKFSKDEERFLVANFKDGKIWRIKIDDYE